MTEPPNPDPTDRTGNDTDAHVDRGATASTPRWVKAGGIVVIVLVVLIAIALLGGGHGPARHSSSGALADDTPTSTVALGFTDDDRSPGSDSSWP